MTPEGAFVNLTDLTICSGVSVVDFEQVNASQGSNCAT